MLQEVIEHQRELFLQREDWQGRPGGLYAYFAGEDDGDVLAASSGLEFRPVRVAFGEVMRWDADALAHFRATDLAGRMSRLTYPEPFAPDAAGHGDETRHDDDLHDRSEPNPESARISW